MKVLCLLLSFALAKDLDGDHPKHPPRPCPKADGIVYCTSGEV